MSVPLHDPHDTIIRKVLRYPANGDDPHLVSMEFSEEGAKRPGSICFTTLLDLRNTYGKYLGGTRTQLLTVENQPLKCNEGEYQIHFNIDVLLPLNLSMARVVGMNPKRPGSRPTWRGDVIVVKQEEWPGPRVMGGGNHMNYFDIDPSFRVICDTILFKRWYESEEWEKLLESEKELHKLFGPETGHLSNARMGLSQFDPKKYASDVKHYEERGRIIDRLGKYLEEQAVRASQEGRCARCDSDGDPSLRVCSGCHKTRYCSRECQKADWKRHKPECKV